MEMATPVHNVDVGTELAAISLNGLSQTIWPRHGSHERAPAAVTAIAAERQERKMRLAGSRGRKGQEAGLHEPFHLRRFARLSPDLGRERPRGRRRR